MERSYSVPSGALRIFSAIVIVLEEVSEEVVVKFMSFKNLQLYVFLSSVWMKGKNALKLFY